MALDLKLMGRIVMDITKADAESSEIVFDNDGNGYYKFKHEYACEEFCNKLNIEPDIYCFNGYMNAVKVDDVTMKLIERLA